MYQQHVRALSLLVKTFVALKYHQLCSDHFHYGLIKFLLCHNHYITVFCSGGGQRTVKLQSMTMCIQVAAQKYKLKLL